MKALSEYVSEQFLIGNDNVKIQDYDYHPMNKNELSKIIDQKIYDNRVNKEDVINMNDIDTSRIVDFTMLFYNRSDIKNIDISDWETGKVKSMKNMFAGCINLESIGDISNWEVKNLKYMQNAFAFCKNLKDVGDLDKWKISSTTNIDNAFSKSGLVVPKWAKS